MQPLNTGFSSSIHRCEAAGKRRGVMARALRQHAGRVAKTVCANTHGRACPAAAATCGRIRIHLTERLAYPDTLRVLRSISG